MKFLRYIGFLFYSYYSKGAGQNVAYLRSVLLLTLLVYIHLLIASLVFSFDKHIPLSMNDSKPLRYLKLLLFLSPIFFIFYFGIKEKNLIVMKEKLGYEHWEKEFNHRVILFLYLFFSFAVLMILAILRKQ